MTTDVFESPLVATFGSIDLTSETFALLEGYSLGSPAVVVQALTRQLMDGEIVSHLRDSNRELQFRVRVSGPDVLALNEAESLLVAEVHATRNVLTLKKPGLSTPASVYDTFRGSLREVPNDLLELPVGDRRVHRVYEVTLPASPHAHAPEKVVVSGLMKVSTADVQIDAMNATTGWAKVNAGSSGDTLTADTAVKYEGTASLTVVPAGSAFEQLPGGAIRWMVETAVEKTFAPITMATSPYLSVLVATKGYDTLTLTAHADGVILEEVASVQVDVDWRRVTYFIDAPITRLRFDLMGEVTVTNSTVADPNVPPGFGPLRFDDLRRQGFPPNGPTSLTGRQWVRTLPVEGSVRTPASLQVSSEANALGDTLVYVGKGDRPGFWPGLRKWRTAGAPGGDPGSPPMSGSWTEVPESASSLAPNPVFEVPISTLKPGAYAVMTRFGFGYGEDWQLNLRAQTVIGGVTVGQPQELTMQGPTFNSVAVHHIGVLHLPPATVPTVSAGVVRFGLWLTSTDLDIAPTLDDIWIFPLDGALVVLPALTQHRLFLDSPSLDQPLGGIWVGNAVDRSDAFSAGPLLTAYQRPEIAPPASRIWFATGGAADSVVSLEYYPTAHTNNAYTPPAG